MSARVLQRGRRANETTPTKPAVASVAAGSAPVKEAAAMPSSQARARNARIMSLCDGYERRNVGEDGLRDDVARQEVFDGCEGAIGGARLDDALRPDLADAGKRLEFRLARGVDVDEGSLAGAGNGAAAQRRDEDVVFVRGAQAVVEEVGNAVEKGDGEKGDDEPAIAFELVSQARGPQPGDGWAKYRRARR